MPTTLEKENSWNSKGRTVTRCARTRRAGPCLLKMLLLQGVQAAFAATTGCFYAHTNCSECLHDPRCGWCISPSGVGKCTAASGEAACEVRSTDFPIACLLAPVLTLETPPFRFGRQRCARRRAPLPTNARGRTCCRRRATTSAFGIRRSFDANGPRSAATATSSAIFPLLLRVAFYQS